MKRFYVVINVLFLLSVGVYLWDVFYLDRTVNHISFSKKHGDFDSIDFGRYGLFYQQYQLDTFENRYHLKKELTGCLLDTTMVFLEDGLLTIRFLVNKDGNADRFRAAFINSDYKDVNLRNNDGAVRQLINCLKSRQKWQKGTVDGKPRNYHSFINLRIENGRINGIF